MPSEKEIIDILFKNRNIKEIVNGSPFSEGINWYLAGGCIHQTIWNHLLGNNSEHGIIDYDLVYYDSHDLSEESERNNQARINKIFKSLGAEIEVEKL
jgi:hypothetical protein